MDGVEAEASKYLGQDMMWPFDISIIIVNYNARELLRRCLKSVIDGNSKKSIEIMVIDNASKDGSSSMIKADFPGVKLIPNQDNLGFAGGANQGIRASQGRNILLLNPDTLVRTDEIDKMVDFVEENGKIGICGPRMTDPKDNLQYSCRRFPTYLTSISSRQSLLFKFFPKNPLSREYLLTQKHHRQEMEVDWVSGSALLARKDMLDEIGLLDENFFMYAEDVDLCLRAKKSGWKVFYYPGACVVHLVGASTSREKSKMIIQHHRSMYRFYRKHYSPKPIFATLVLWGIFFRMGMSLLGLLAKSLVLADPKEGKA